MFDKIIEVVMQFLSLGQFWVILKPFEQGVLLRVGKFIRVVEPGFHWVWPLGIDHVMFESVVPRTHNLGSESVTTKDGKSAGFRAIITYRIKDIEKALLQVHEIDHAVSDSCAGEIGRVLRETDWHDILHTDIGEKLTTACRKRGFRWGMEIISVQLSSLSLVKNIRIMGDTIPTVQH